MNTFGGTFVYIRNLVKTHIIKLMGLLEAQCFINEDLE